MTLVLHINIQTVQKQTDDTVEREGEEAHDGNTDNVKNQAKTNGACTHAADVAALCFPQGHVSADEGVETHDGLQLTPAKYAVNNIS